MEKINYFFNCDFERYLELKQQDPYISSKQSQEFEYLINYLDLSSCIYTTKDYGEEFKKRFKKLTRKDFLTITEKMNVTPWCQENGDQILLRKIQDKSQTLLHFKKKNLIKHEVKLIHSESELEENFLYKEPFSLSGMGHYTFPKDEKRLRKIIQKKKIIKEEKLNRILDFSTLFNRKERLWTYLNRVDEYFQYKGTLIGPKEYSPPQKVKELYKKAIEEVLNYTGNYNGIFSVDSFLYQNENEIFLQPVSEINMRKTMGYCALKIKEKYFPKAPYFLFSLIRNPEIDSKKILSNESESTHLLSPIENRFHLWVITGSSLEEVNQQELKLICDSL